MIYNSEPQKHVLQLEKFIVHFCMSECQVTPTTHTQIHILHVCGLSNSQLRLYTSMTHVPWNKDEDDTAAVLFTAVG